MLNGLALFELIDIQRTDTMNKLSSCAVQVAIINDLRITDFQAFKIILDSTWILPNSSMPFASVNVNAVLRSVSDAGRSEY